MSLVVKLADIKHNSSVSYLVNFKENLSKGFKIMDVFFKSHAFKKCVYLKRFEFD